MVAMFPPKHAHTGDTKHTNTITLLLFVHFVLSNIHHGIFITAIRAITAIGKAGNITHQRKKNRLRVKTNQTDQTEKNHLTK